ncbi:hypothetical protein CHS0354_007663 [Potamilus streckersoni]|uniref:Uncharacterized protein n=1 Tax=Potamilus streckersoni TaxID=2493646 RepID=A0AAE0VVP0_9BIVA|nr:hypothetical protein CHS0354_007663 [Potamilus streckersoni]
MESAMMKSKVSAVIASKDTRGITVQSVVMRIPAQATGFAHQEVYAIVVLDMKDRRIATRKDNIFGEIKCNFFYVAKDGSSDLDVKQYSAEVRYFALRKTWKHSFRPCNNIILPSCENANVIVGENKGIFEYVFHKQPRHFDIAGSRKYFYQTKSQSRGFSYWYIPPLRQSSIRKDLTNAYQNILTTED